MLTLPHSPSPPLPITPSPTKMSASNRTETAAQEHPEASARRAGLRYVSDEEPGITRRRRGKGFSYHRPDKSGSLIRGAERERIEALAIPPAWTDVWICPLPDGHLLATGRDDAGRKQYRYHPDWEEGRRRMRFDRLLAFAGQLSQLRARCAHDLRREELPRDKVLALVVVLLDRTLIRIGHEEYADENGSFGLATMRRRHVRFGEGGRFTFAFTGKSEQEHSVELDAPDLADAVRACCEVPGYEIFAFFDEDGRKHDVKAQHVNAYLKETTGADFTSKSFRTWGGTVLAAETLDAMPAPEDDGEAAQQLTDMVKTVAERLGNTPAVCRAHYIHPAVLEAYEAGAFRDRWRAFLDEDPEPQLCPAEHATLRFLEEMR